MLDKCVIGSVSVSSGDINKDRECTLTSSRYIKMRLEYLDSGTARYW